MRTVCRACIATNVRMHRLEDLQLLEIYRKLLGAEIKLESAMPCMLCYICYSKLRSCAAFSVTVQNSAKLLRDFIQKGIEVSINTIEQRCRLKPKLTVSATQFLSVNDLNNDHALVVKEEIVVKEEPIPEDQYDIEYNTETRAFNNSLVNYVKSIDSVKAEQVVIKVEKVENEEFIEFEDNSQLDALFSGSKKVHMEGNESDGTVNTHPQQRKYKNLLSKKYNQQRHTKVYSKKPFKCEVCSQTCSFKANLLIHMRIHTGEKPFICDMCGKAFSFKTSLIPHLRYHMGHRPYPCGRCHKRFTEASSLRRHMLVHTKEKPFACTQCHTTFTEAGSLKRHMQLHAGNFQHYTCDICNKTYRRTETLKRHVLTHNAEKPYACDRCDKRYTEAGTLKRHKQSHHNDYKRP